MSSDVDPRFEARTQIIKLARFAIISTLAFVVVLIFSEFLGSYRPFHFVSENILLTFIYALAAKAIAALTFLSLWRS
jgi:hypothetical protein